MNNRWFWKLLGSYLKPQWRSFIVLMIIWGTCTYLETSNPKVLRQFIDSALGHKHISMIYSLALLFLGFGLLSHSLHVLMTYVGERIRWGYSNCLRLDLTRHCLSLDHLFHRDHTPGEMIERIDGDVNAMSHLCSRLIISLPAHLILLAGILLQTTHEHWIIGLTFSAFCIVVLLVLHVLRRVTEKAWFQERQSSARFFGFLEKHLADLAGHRERGAHGNVMQSFIHYASTLFHAGRRAHIMGNLQVLLIVEPLFFLAKVAMFLLAAYFFKTGVMTIGTVFLIDSYTNMLHHHLGAIGQLFQDFQQAGASITRIRMLFETKPTLRESAVTHQLREVQV